MVVKLIIILYCLAILFIFCNSLVQANLLYHYLKHRFNRKIPLSSDSFPEPSAPTTPTDWPFVTVQLPVYNERYVVERLLEAVASFDYPVTRFEIQVLDDSTDETTALIAHKRAGLQARGIRLHHVRRASRTGFKAGALAEGLARAQGELLAIFDADFVPTPDFLRKTVPHFHNPAVGMVQTRWEHLNQVYSLLTRAQAFALDAHFSVEQQGRYAAGRFINFNGTAGIWRKACIVEAGGWQSDTLTEDLDLSYRAQLKGWQFHYREDLGSPAELPVAMNALKSQQFRWTKGAAECARKNLPAMLRSRTLSWATKLHGFFHLMNASLFICTFTIALLSVPLLFIQPSEQPYRTLLQMSSLCTFGFALLLLFYGVAYSQRQDRLGSGYWWFVPNLLLFLSVSMGLSLHNAIAVFEGYAGRKTPFVRTPKFNIQGGSGHWQEKAYAASQLTGVTVLEGVLCVYFLGGIAAGCYLGNFRMVPFHALVAFGFGLVCYYSLAHAWSTQRV